MVQHEKSNANAHKWAKGVNVGNHGEWFFMKLPKKSDFMYGMEGTLFTYTFFLKSRAK